MPNRFFQDIVPPDRARRAPERIHVPEERPKAKPEIEIDHSPAEEVAPERDLHERDMQWEEFLSSKSRRKSQAHSRNTESRVHETLTQALEVKDRPSFARNKALWLASGVSLFTLFFITSLVFQKVTISAEPIVEEVPVSVEVTASRLDGRGDIKFNAFSYSKSVDVSTSSLSTAPRAQKATGVVQIQNSSTAVLKLVKGTRITDIRTGLVYRLVDDAIVDALTTKNKVKVPGTLEVAVVADEPGAKYNIKTATLSVPGLKGTLRFNLTRVILKKPMSGGFDGSLLSTEDQEKIDAMKRILVETVGQQMFKEATETVQAAHVILKDSFQIYAEDPILESTSKGTSTTMQVSVRGIYVERESLTNFITRRYLSSKSTVPGTLKNLENLKVMVTDGQTLSNPGDSLVLKLTGAVSFVHTVDTARIKQMVAGVPKSQLEEVLATLPGVNLQTVTAHFVFPWFQAVPDDQTRIEIKLKEM
jgi:hypothetical protein